MPLPWLVVAFAKIYCYSSVNSEKVRPDIFQLRLIISKQPEYTALLLPNSKYKAQRAKQI